MVLSDAPEDGALSLKGMGIRRCRGCVKCLTENHGGCAIDDGFSKAIPDILSAHTLYIDADTESGRLPLNILKAVERLSNVLEIYTDSGGNVPMSSDGVSLREVVFRIKGSMDKGPFEAEMVQNLRKGPVRDVRFEYE